MAKKHDHAEDNLMAVEDALSKSEQFIEKNQRIITIVIGAVVVIILAYLGYQRYFLAPKNLEAQEQMFMAEKYFEKDSFDLALYGDGGNYLGFLDIIDEYGITKSANLAHYYAGVCFLHRGEYDDAISFLKKFSSKDMMVSAMAQAAMGDAYMENGDTKKALSHYEKAAGMHKNEFSTPFFLLKAGMACEELGRYDNAATYFEKIKKEYPTSSLAREVDQHIARVKGEIDK
ncbi:MAG: tetratricopeptide repeat protein [Bacteroidetes bacterium]|nr:MAG: tetratricopeptide repeat protein [Bacteroidota bacterium]